MKYLVANWKQHHTIDSARSFLQLAREPLQLAKNIEIIVCPPFPLLPALKSEIAGTRIKLGAQNLSQFEDGAYTGEVGPAQLNGLADYAIIGHSERKKYFHETMEEIWQKVNLAREYGIHPILCFEKVEELKIIDNTTDLILAYEPTFAIGTGHPDTPENAVKTAAATRKLVKSDLSILYGGSVKPDNIKSFVKYEEISGCLIGGASLEPNSLVDLVHAAS